MTKSIPSKKSAHPKTTPSRPLKAASIRAKKPSRLSADYSRFGVSLLLMTTIYWSYLGAKIQSFNADQLINSYLFESTQTFHQAILPTTHSFLLKWPIFLAIRWLGLTQAAFTFFTVLVSVSTVGAIAYLLYRIDRRPVVFGTFCLGLASILLLVPAAPYAGGILPVNMAMLATRNIEYVLYIGGLVLLLKAQTFKSWRFMGSVLVLGILGASDKLFLTLSLGGAGLSLFCYGLVQRWAMVRAAVRWLTATLFAWALAAGTLWAIQKSGLVILVGAQSSPYNLIHSVKNAALGLVFGCLGVVTNFGANPAFDAAILRSIPHLTRQRLMSYSGFSYAVNLVLFCIGIFLTLRVYLASFRHVPAGKKTDNATKLAAMLGFSSVTAFVAFVATDHYYVVDERYLTIILLWVIIGCAAYLKRKEINPGKLPFIVAMILTISVLCGMYASYGTYTKQNQGLAAMNQRNGLIAEALKNHHVDTLVGDYWRTVPIRSLKPSQRITPLGDCTQPTSTLNSKNWQTNLSSHSFAYLLSFDHSLTNFPQCSLEQVLRAYGRPNSSILVAGRLEQPTELLLFYDQGFHQSVTPINTQTVLPVAPEQLPKTNCSYTVMNIVAHEDDDLLFLSPDLQHAIKDHRCVRTVYVTAGDSGLSSLYWLNRERGSEAAYTKLTGSSAPWVQRTVKVGENQFVTQTNLKGDPSVLLIFLHLPDGDPQGHGFSNSRAESLERLETHKIAMIHSVDNQSVYDSEGLTRALVKLMQLYEPSEIRTQATASPDPHMPDHSDHMAVGRYVARAYQKYRGDLTVPLTYYIGYPIKHMAANVEGEDLELKTAVFLTYSQFDPATCHSRRECEEAGNYGAYLARQYTTSTP